MFIITWLLCVWCVVGSGFFLVEQRVDLYSWFPFEYVSSSTCDLQCCTYFYTLLLLLLLFWYVTHHVVCAVPLTNRGRDIM